MPSADSWRNTGIRPQRPAPLYVLGGDAVRPLETFAQRPASPRAPRTSLRDLAAPESLAHSLRAHLLGRPRRNPQRPLPAIRHLSRPCSPYRPHPPPLRHIHLNRRVVPRGAQMRRN